jgi:hypothetical protein
VNKCLWNKILPPPLKEGVAAHGKLPIKKSIFDHLLAT